jgi:hypothetical protein
MSAQFSSARLSCETQVMIARFRLAQRTRRQMNEIAIEFIQTEPD